MIELGRHIEILLLTNDCVIVPGLGGFMAHHVEARHDADESLFLPPLRTLGFNPQLKLNDSLLAQSYIEAYDISYPEAIRRIENEVGELKQHIANEGKYELNDIGTLSLNSTGNYLFEPCEAGILTPELYGLSSFEISELSQDNNTILPKDIIKTELPKEADIEEPEPDDEIKADDDDDSTIKIKVAWIRNAVATAAAIIAFLFITTPISNSDSDFVISSIDGSGLLHVVQGGGSDVNTIKISPAQIKEVVAQKDTAAKTVTDSSAVADKKQNATIVEKSTDEPYCIVLASQITRKNAESYVKELHNNGLGQAQVYINNNMVRVVYGSFESEADAYKTLQSVCDNKYFEQAWVYKKR